MFPVRAIGFFRYTTIVKCNLILEMDLVWAKLLDVGQIGST